jgi:signal transduction histidine kinase
MLILSKMLAESPDNNLNEKQVEFAETIHSSGADLLALINEILDLSKIESGTMGVEIGEVHFGELLGDVERTFSQIATDKGIQLVTELDERLPQLMETDVKRLRQVLKNLLSNAFKFTHQGQVAVEIKVAESGWSFDTDSLNQASSVIAFTVSDTGIGIPEDKQQLIFEAFQQADGQLAANTEEPVWGCRSAARLPGFWAGKSSSKARRAKAVPSLSISRRLPADN